MYQGLRDLKWVELFFLHQCTFGGPPYRVAFRWSSHGLQCEPSSGSPCGAQHWLCGSPCASQCEPSRLSPCAGCLPPVSPYSRSPTSCMVKAFQGRLWFKVLVIGISSKRKQHSRNTWHFEIMLHARNSFVSSLQTARLGSRRLRSGWLRFLVATDCSWRGTRSLTHCTGAMEYTWGLV